MGCGGISFMFLHEGRPCGMRLSWRRAIHGSMQSALPRRAWGRERRPDLTERDDCHAIERLLNMKLLILSIIAAGLADRPRKPSVAG